MYVLLRQALVFPETRLESTYSGLAANVSLVASPSGSFVYPYTVAECTISRRACRDFYTCHLVTAAIWLGFL